MERRKARKLAAASVAGLLAAAASVAGGSSPAQAHGEEGVPCYGINKCKGTGDCGGKGHGCHGRNACQGQGFITLDNKELCLRIANGRLTAEPVTRE